MFLDAFHQTNNNTITISAEQGSRFAKEVSDDFNPLHNPDNKRFVVPGDLLFALTLSRLGLSQKMQFNYTGMVGKDAELIFPDEHAPAMSITDSAGKTYLNISSEGDITENASLIEAFTKAYVAFSGHSFPHILVPLMKANNVMINPARPMVMYESMAFEFNNLNLDQPNLKFVDSQLDVDGKRGRVQLEFDILDHQLQVGHGIKTMVLSGLRAYEQQAVDGLIALYQESKQAYTK